MGGGALVSAPRNVRGSVMPRRRVPCVDCGKELLRANYFDRSRCPRCQDRKDYRRQAAQLSKVRTQARRYRLVCHYLGWDPDQFEEMLAEMRASPMAFRRSPETRAARLDLHNERKRRAA